MANILVESKKHGTIVEFTPEQWDNMKRTGHDKAWKVLSTEGLLPEKKFTPIEFSQTNHVERFGNSEQSTHLDIEFKLDDYRKLLDDAGVKYNHQIKNPLKLKELWEKFKNNDDFSA